jgi:hypothetical protein
MTGALKQMRSSMDLMARSVRQMQFLRQRIEAIETRQQASAPAVPPPKQPNQQSPTTSTRAGEPADPTPDTFPTLGSSPESWALNDEIFHRDLPIFSCSARPSSPLQDAKPSDNPSTFNYTNEFNPSLTERTFHDNSRSYLTTE